LKAGYTGDQERVYFLDKETSLPVKVVAYLNSEARAQDRPLTVWQPTEIRQIQGYPVIWTSIQRDYTGDGGTLAHTREYRVESVAFNRNHSREEFRVPVEPNALVIDTTTKEMVQQPPAPVTSAQQSTQVMTPAPAIRAEPDRAWFDLAAPLSAGTGLFLIAIGFWLSRRRP
jgi:hypothetical protein